MPLFYGWSGHEPDFLWSGFSEEDSAAYAVWAAMQDGDEPGDAPPPAENLRRDRDGWGAHAGRDPSPRHAPAPPHH